MVRKLHYPVLTLLVTLILSVPLMGVESVRFGASTGMRSPRGDKPQADLPQQLWKKNIAASGLGCCVFRSIDHSAYWQNLPQLNEMPEWMVQKRIPGGGYPSKVDKLIPQLCQDRGAEVPPYIQVESNDLEILKLACKTRRMVCVTYAYSPTGRYNRQRIAHMVNLAGWNVSENGEEWLAILDNNYIDEYEWLTPQEFLPVYHGGRQNGWAIIFLDHPPPPIPKNTGT